MSSCHELFRGIDFKGHIKTKHSSNSSIIKCFECQYEAERLENFKTHAKQHYSTDKDVKHEKCNVCYKVFKNKLELGRHMESVHKEECDVCSKVFKNKIELKKHVENIHIFEEDESTIENLGIIHKPEIMPRIKQHIKLSDLEYDSDADEDFEDQLNANPVAVKTPPLEIQQVWRGNVRNQRR